MFTGNLQFQVYRQLQAGDFPSQTKANKLNSSKIMPTKDSEPTKLTGWAQRNTLPTAEEASMNSSMAVMIPNDDVCSMNDQTPFEKDQTQLSDDRPTETEIHGVPRSNKNSAQTGHRKIETADASLKKGEMTAHSFASSLSSKPSSDDEATSSLAKKAKDKTLSASINDFTMETNTCDNSDASRDEDDFGMSYQNFQGTLDNNDHGNSDNIFVSLYSDIVYLLVHGNKQEDESERNIATIDAAITSQIDSCASDTSGALDQEDEQASQVEIHALCFLCGNHKAHQRPDLHQNWTSQEFKYSADLEQVTPTCEARDVLIESECVDEEDSREPCPRETIHENVIPKDDIPDVGIFDNESEESDDTDEELVIVTKRDDKGESTSGIARDPPLKCMKAVEAVKINDPRPLGSHTYFCLPSCVEKVKNESPEPFLQKAMAKRGHRPVQLLAYTMLQASPSINTRDSIVQISKTDSSESPNVQTHQVDDKEILEVIHSISNRVQHTKSQRSPPTDLLQPFVHGTILPDIDRYMDNLEGPLEVLSRGVKDLLVTELNTPVNTDMLHLQPVQELGESQNMYIELPVREIPHQVLPPEAFNWKKELNILEDIVREEICRILADDEGGLGANVLKDKCLALPASVVGIITDPSKGCTDGHVNAIEQMKRTFSDESNETTSHYEFVPEEGDFVHNDQSSVLAWLASFQDGGITHSTTTEGASELEENSKKTFLPDLEEYLNQPTVNLDLEWQDIPVPVIDDLLQTSPSFQEFLSQPCSETPSELCLGWQGIQVAHLLDESPSIQDFLTQSSTTDTTGGDSWDNIPLPQLKPLPVQDFVPDENDEGTEINLVSHNLSLLTMTSRSHENNECNSSIESIYDSFASEFGFHNSGEPSTIAELISGSVPDETGIRNAEALFDLAADPISYDIDQNEQNGNAHSEETSTGDADELRQDTAVDVSVLAMYGSDTGLDDVKSKHIINFNNPEDNHDEKDETNTATIELLNPTQTADFAALSKDDQATDLE